jgi:hypothetical protein
MKFYEPKEKTSKQVAGYIVGGAIALYILGALAGGPTGFVAVMENITATNPIVTVFLGLVLVFFVLGVINHFYPIL